MSSLEEVERGGKKLYTIFQASFNRVPEIVSQRVCISRLMDMLPTLDTPSSQLHYSTPCKTLSRLSMSSGGSQLEIVGYSQSLPINHFEQHAKNLNVSKSGKKRVIKLFLPTLDKDSSLEFTTLAVLMSRTRQK